jgi:serine/threonine-protein kinase RsbW
MGTLRPNSDQRQADDQPKFHRSFGPIRNVPNSNVAEVTKPLRLSVEAEGRALAPMRQALRAWLTELEAHEVADVVLAVDEAVANAIEHAGLASTEVIVVEGRLVENTLHFEICDGGVWKEPTANEARGRGLLIMNAVMDDVALVHRDDETRVVMSRHLR